MRWYKHTSSELKSFLLCLVFVGTLASCALKTDTKSPFHLLALHRWGNTPMDEAKRFEKHDVVTILEQFDPPAAVDHCDEF